MNFFRKKKETQPSVTVSNTSVQEALEHDFVVSPVSHIQANGKVKLAVKQHLFCWLNLWFIILPDVTSPTYQQLPYSVDSTQQSSRQVNEACRIVDEIPFQLSPAYDKLLSPENAGSKHVNRIKAVDWDALCYDFRLEKSVTQA